MSRLVPPYIDRLTRYVPGKPIEELERELGIRNAVKLASNENPRGPSPRVAEALARAAATVNRYPDGNSFRLREALAKHHGVTMDEIAVGNGSNDLIDLLCRTFVSPSDHAVCGDPSFVCYRLGLTSANVPFTEVALRNRVEWDTGALLGATRPETRLLFVANPNNPTGTHMARAELERLARELPSEVTLVVDEAYFEFADAEDYVSALELRSLRERLVVLRTFSKAYGLAGLRVGYAIAPANIADYIHRVRPPFNVSSMGQAAALAALSDPDHVASYVDLNRRERTRVSRAIGELGLSVVPSQANFVLVQTKQGGKVTYEKLLQRGVIVRPQPPPIEDSVRITIGLPEENDRLLAALREIEHA